MDYLQMKLALLGRPSPRLPPPDPRDIADPKRAGALPSDERLKLGTASLERRENIQIVASNSKTKTTILLELKWRPVTDGKLSLKGRYVTLASRLIYVKEGSTTYEYESVDTYEPSVSSIYGGQYITQYGRDGSDLRLFILSPHRRMRLVFRGHMKVSSAQSGGGGGGGGGSGGGGSDSGSGDQKFVRLNFVINATGPVFDFKDKFDERLLAQSYKENAVKRPVNNALEDLLLHDRHEHLVRAVGEFQLNEANANDNIRDEVFLCGYHSRTFVGEHRPITTKRLIGTCYNGQVMHIGTRIGQDNDDRIEFGYSCFKVPPETTPLDRRPAIDWDLIAKEPKPVEYSFEVDHGKFKVESASAGITLLPQLRTLSIDGRPGWAWVEVDEQNFCDDQVLSEALIEDRNRALVLIEEGRIVGPIKPMTQELIQAKPFVVQLDEPACMHLDLVGAKASSLAHLMHLSDKPNTGYMVPNGVVLTRYAHDAYIEANNELRESIDKFEQTLGDSTFDSSKLDEMCANLQKLTENAKMPDQVSEELFSRLGTDIDSKQYAVRSSSWAEDEADMSAAGQLETVLGVRGRDRMLAAVRKCLASKFSRTNIEYRRQHGLPPSLPMAIVVQELVDCKRAGVMFTCEPTSGNTKRIVITANYGLGESVVSGQSEPDTIECHVHDQDISIAKVAVGSKSSVVDSNTLQGNQARDYGDRTKCCLSDDDSKQLARCGRLVATYFGSARDIEWGMLEDGAQVYLFQSRPVTGLDAYSNLELLHEADMPSRSEQLILSRANIGEVMPYPMTPLSLTMFMSDTWTNLAYNIISKFTSQADYLPGFGADLSYEMYHGFFNLTSSVIFNVNSSKVEEKPLIARAMEIGMFGHEMEVQPDLVEFMRGFKAVPNPFQGFWYEFHSLGLRYMTITKVKGVKSELKRLRDAVHNLTLISGAKKAYEQGGVSKLRFLYNLIHEIPNHAFQAWYNHFLMIMLGNQASIQLIGFLTKFFKDPMQIFSTLAKFQALCTDVISAEIPRRIDEMAEMVRASGQDEVQSFLGLTDADAFEYIKANPELSKRYSDFIERFGHRCYSEFELRQRPWRENQVAVLDMLRQNCASSSVHKKNIPPRASTIDEVIDSLGIDMTFMERYALKNRLVPKVLTTITAREFTKDGLIDYTDSVRAATRMLARELVQQLRLPDEELLYYVLHEELETLIEAPQPAIVTQAIRRRAMFNRLFKEPWKYGEIIRGPPLSPQHMQPDKELDEKVSKAPKLYGTPASSGRVKARACVVKDYKDLSQVRAGDILITHSTDIAFSPVFPLIVGIITEVGGLISHGAVVAREYGLPSLLGIPDVTKIIQDGEEIILDADKGTIVRLGLEQAIDKE